ncbi:MAG: hypothetical protein SCM11_17150 [Bacillota bacterium]|nr:hypothetical protein [Bacillota bacterium]
MVSRLKTGGQVIVGVIIGLIDSIVTMVRMHKFDIQLLLTNVGIYIVGALIGGAGVGSKYFNSATGYFKYQGRWFSSNRIVLSNPKILADFGRALAKYIYTSFLSALAKIVI